MLGVDSGQRSLFDADLAVEELLNEGSFYEVLYRLGPRLLLDEEFSECYDVTTRRPSVPPSRMFKPVLLQAYEDLSDRKAIERMAFGRFVEGLLETGVIPADGVQLVDSSAIWGRGTVQDTYNLIGSAVRKVLGVTARRRTRSPERWQGSWAWD